MKDLDDEMDIEPEDLRADLRHKYDRLLDQGSIEKTDDDNNDKIVKEEKALKTGSKNSSRENVMFVEKLVTKVQIVGLWKQTRISNLHSLSERKHYDKEFHR